MVQICPKCAYVRQPDDTGDPGTCPACGLIIAKYLDASAKTDLKKLERKSAARSGNNKQLHWIGILFALILCVGLVNKYLMHHNDQPGAAALAPAPGQASDLADQGTRAPVEIVQFTELFNRSKPLSELAQRGQITVVEVYLDQCSYCRELEAALEPLRSARPDLRLVRVHHPGTFNHSMQATSRAELADQMKAMQARMESYQLCGSPHVEVYGPNREPLAVDTCKQHDGTAYLWDWITKETGVRRKSAAGAVTGMS